MPELRTNGVYEPYLAELFNPLGAGGQVSPGVFGGIGAGGIGAGAQNLLTQSGPQMNALLNTIWPQQQQVAAQCLQAIQIAQQLAGRQVVQAIQQAQALQVLQQLVQSLIAQQQVGAQPQFGIGAGPIGANPMSQGFGQPYGQSAQHSINQALQHQATQQLLQNLGAFQTNPFRYGTGI